MKKIIFTRPDGGLSVVHPVINSYPVREDITEAQAIERAYAKLPQGAINPQIVEVSVLPVDRTFRNAWKQNGSTVAPDMPACREIHKERLRVLRAPLLTVLDAQFLKALEIGDLTEQGRIAAKKQALRDVTDDPRIATASTPEQLKSVVPAVLQ